jgi:hypothetical protein
MDTQANIVKIAKLQRSARGLLAGYALQFLAGMTLNLFVTIPAKHPGASSSEYFSGALRGLGWALADKGGWALAVHAYLAVALVLGSVVLCYLSVQSHLKRWIVASTIAMLVTVGALFNGLSFINYNHDISSMIMAICWLTAVGALVFVLIKSDKRE